MKLRRRARDGIWILEIKNEKGERISRSTGSRDRLSAERSAMAILTEEGLVDKEFTLGAALDATWRSRWQHQKSAHNQWYRAQRVRKDIGMFLCKDISYLLLETWSNQLEEEGQSNSSINHLLGTASIALNLAMKRGDISGVPPIPRRPVSKGRTRWLTPEEEDHLLSVASCPGTYAPKDMEPTENHIHYAKLMPHFVTVCLDTGCRLSEVTGLAPEDITDRTIRLMETKNGRNRALTLTTRAAHSARWLMADPVWREITRRVRDSRVRQRSAKDWLTKKFRLIRNAADLPDVTIHVLRHTCASRLVQAGADVYRVKDYLGHSSISVTERYAHLAPDALAELAALLERYSADIINLPSGQYTR